MAKAMLSWVPGALNALYPKLTSYGFPEALEHKTEEVGRLKKDLRLKDEVIQQREIEISCLRGQVKIFSIASFDLVWHTFKEKHIYRKKPRGLW